jgi:hypothetical protein
MQHPGEITKIPLEMHPTGHSARYDKAGALPTDAGSNVPSLILHSVELDMFPQVETGAGGPTGTGTGFFLPILGAWNQGLDIVYKVPSVV